jgi:uncharacterized protein YjbI with pentapeptide repeats
MKKEIDKELLEQLRIHFEWIESEGKQGHQLNLSNANLSNVDFLAKDMRFVKFDGANLYYADFSRCVLDSASLIEANLFHADLTKADLAGANFTNANLVGIRAYRASFDETNMYRANLAGADLRGADLPRAHFEQAVLRYANLGAVTLRNTYFYKTDLYGAENLDTVQIYSIKIGPPEIPITLEGEEARAWLLRAARGEVENG